MITLIKRFKEGDPRWQHPEDGRIYDFESLGELFDHIGVPERASLRMSDQSPDKLEEEITDFLRDTTPAGEYADYQIKGLT